MQPSKEVVALTSQTDEALKKLGWIWVPKVGDWCIWSGGLHLVMGKPFYRDDYDGGMRPGQGGLWVNCRSVEQTIDIMHRVENCTPILRWEDDIEPALEGLGYWLDTPEKLCDKQEYEVVIWTKKRGILGYGQTRQESVMRAVIKLAEEVGK